MTVGVACAVLACIAAWQPLVAFSVEQMDAAGLRPFTNEYYYAEKWPGRVVWPLGVLTAVGTLGWILVAMVPQPATRWIASAQGALWTGVVGAFVAGELIVNTVFDQFFADHHLTNLEGASFSDMLHPTPWFWVGVVAAAGSAVAAALWALGSRQLSDTLEVAGV